MSELPKLSVVVIVRDEPQGLEYAARSFAAQTLPTDAWELVLVDDGSVEPAGEVFRRAADLPNLRVIRQYPGKGRCGARNVGIRAARGEVIVLYDGDAYAGPDLLERHRDFHARNPDKVLLGARYEASWETLRRLRAGRPTRPDLAMEQDIRLLLFGLDAEGMKTFATPWAATFTHNMSVPRQLLIDVGMLDENFQGWGHEDVDLGYRLFAHLGRRRGSMVYDTEAYVFHIPQFHDVGKEHVTARLNGHYMRQKYQRYDAELFGRGVPWLEPKVDYYDLILDAFRVAGLGDLPEAALAELVPEDTDLLLVGGGQPPRLRTGRTITWNHAIAESSENRHLLGVDMPFADGELSTVVYVDLWRYLLPYDLDTAVVESLRVSPTLHLVSSSLAVDDSLAGCTPEHARRMLASTYATAERTMGDVHVLTVTAR